MPFVMQSLDNMFKKTYIEDETVCMSYTPVDVFGVISKIFDCYQSCDHEELYSSLLGLSFKMLSALIDEIKVTLKDGYCPEDDILAAITNSYLKFVSCLRSFLDRVCEETHASAKTVNNKINLNILIKEFSIISNSALEKIQEKIIKTIEDQFLQIDNYQ